LIGKVNLCNIVFHLQVADRSQSNMSMEMGNQSNVSSVSTLDTCSEQLTRTDAVSCSSGVVYTQSACHEDLISLQGCLPDIQAGQQECLHFSYQPGSSGNTSE